MTDWLKQTLKESAAIIIVGGAISFGIVIGGSVLVGVIILLASIIGPMF